LDSNVRAGSTPASGTNTITMERLFSPVSLVSITDSLKERALEIKYIGDISDLGNEVGITVGEFYKNMNENEIELFIQGFRHGVSLTNGNH
jgi:hypothetical protein